MWIPCTVLIIRVYRKSLARGTRRFYDQVTKISRYAIKKESDIFDKEQLQEAVAAIPDGYTLKKIEENEYNACLCENWCKDLVSNFKDYDSYEKMGLGFVAMKEAEIEIDTREDHRRRGLAYACGAKLILECLERGIYPSLDAHNLASVGLAEKLGYHLDYEYLAYEFVLK